MCDQNDQRTIRFIPLADLIRMGYVMDEGQNQSNPTVPTTPIVVPIGERRNFEGNWRKR